MTHRELYELGQHRFELSLEPEGWYWQSDTNSGITGGPFTDRAFAIADINREMGKPPLKPKIPTPQIELKDLHWVPVPDLKDPPTRWIAPFQIAGQSFRVLAIPVSWRDGCMTGYSDRDEQYLDARNDSENTGDEYLFQQGQSGDTAWQTIQIGGQEYVLFVERGDVQPWEHGTVRFSERPS